MPKVAQLLTWPGFEPKQMSPETHYSFNYDAEMNVRHLFEAHLLTCQVEDEEIGRREFEPE